MKKAKFDVKPAAMSIVLLICEKMKNHCDDESAIKIKDLLDFFSERINKPYHYLTYDQLLLIWNIITACFNDNLLALNHDEFKAVYEANKEIARLLDSKDEKEWKHFTLIQSLPTTSHTTETTQEK